MQTLLGSSYISSREVPNVTLRTPNKLFPLNYSLERMHVLSRGRRFRVLFHLDHHPANPKTCSYVIVKLDTKSLKPWH